MNANFRLAILVMGAAIFAACGKPGTSVDDSGTVYLDSATAFDFEKHTVLCADGSNGNCVQICHIPPGDPANQQSLRISPSAVDAHLAHALVPTERDYLGECTTLPVPTPVPSPTPPQATPTPTPTPPVCTVYPITDLDQNCDGIDDVTGLPLY